MNRLAPQLLILLGIILSFYSLCSITKNYFLFKHSHTTVGLVKKVIEVSNTENEGYQYKIIFKYKNGDYETITRHISRERKYFVGQMLFLSVPARDPQSAVVNTFCEKYQLNVEGFGVGMLVYLSGFLLLHIRKIKCKIVEVLQRSKNIIKLINTNRSSKCKRYGKC